MNPRLRALFFVVLPFSLNLWAATAHRVQSRSVMDSCEFVYRVEADVRGSPPSELYEIFGGAPLYLRLWLVNEWSKNPNEFNEYRYIEVDVEQMMADWTLVLMSTSEKYLYRRMRFDWGVLEPEKGLFFSLSSVYEAQIGRDFGEPCRTTRGSDKEFRDRKIVEIPASSIDEL